jgi:hypothetical protein
MDELGATLRRISKFLRRQRVDTSTASVSRLEDGHLFARACKLAGSHQARGTRADDQEMGSSLREHYPIPMPRAKKPPQLSAKERALLNRPDRLSEEEIKRLTTREIFAYFKIIDKVDSRAMFVEWWNARSESTSRPPGAVPSGEASERHQKMPRLVKLPGRRCA